MKKWLVILLIATAIGGSAYYFLGSTRNQSLAEKSLTFAEIRQATIRDVVSATGLVEPREIVVVAAESSGTIVQLYGRVGVMVASGDSLAQLDDRRIALKLEEARNGVKMAEAAFMQANASLTQALAHEDAAQRNLKIQKELANTGGFRSEREQAEAQVGAALAGIKAAQAGVEVARTKQYVTQTAVKEAELLRDMASIKVPGLSLGMPKREFLVLDRKVHEGQMVGPQAGPLFTLAGSLDVVEVHAQVAEGDINRVRRDLAAEFIIKGFSDEDLNFPGTVKEIRPQATNIKGAVYYDTVIEVKNRKDPTTGEWQLRPGMTAQVDIIRREHANVWKVPINALNFILEDGYQNAAIKAQLAEWRKRADAKDWRTLWVWDDVGKRVMPIQVRIDGVTKTGETGLKDSDGNEILEWEAGQEPTGTMRVIIGAPPAKAPGLFDQPANLKI